jgi:hypothetical protein
MMEKRGSVGQRGCLHIFCPSPKKKGTSSRGILSLPVKDGCRTIVALCDVAISQGEKSEANPN